MAAAPEKNALNAEQGNGRYARLAAQDAIHQLEPDQAEQGSHDRSPQLRHHLQSHQHRPPSRPRSRPQPHLHHTASQQPSTSGASDASSPTRTPSTSSSTLTQPSTFPSATSRARAIDGTLETPVHHDNTDARDPADNSLRGEPQAIGDTDINDGDDYDNLSAPDHVHFEQLHHYPSSQRHQLQQQEQAPHQQGSNCFLAASLSQPRSLLASPQLGLRSRVWRSGSTGAAREAVSQSRSRNHSHSGRASVEDKSSDPTHESARDDKANDDVAESVNSRALAWDQTCLRIAYLVGTMVTPSANASVGGGGEECRGEADGRPAETSAAGWNDSQTAVTNGAQAARYDTADSIAATHNIMPGLLDNLAEQCTKGWVGAKPIKKRRKIAQIMHWQNEVLAYLETVYCGCAEGSPIPVDSLLVTTAPAAAPASQSAAGSGADAASRCDYCVHPLMPKRPVVWVSDPKDNNDEDIFKKARRSQEGTGDSVRKAFKSIRGLVLNMKSKRTVSMPVTTHAAAITEGPSVPPPPGRTPSARPLASLAAVLPTAPTLNKVTSCRRAWSQWDDINSERLRNASEEMKALHFPQTAMYRVQVENPEVSPAPPPANRSSSGLPPAKEPAKESADVVCDGKGKKAAAGDGCDEADEDYDPNENSQSGRNKLQEVQARLRRAERLLRRSAAAAAQTAGS
ncbi:hypothetical protein SEPCBS119000_000270 [Sporothrix epigloea]|uniref:Uncharacterized protein n=1 Tax=Sporothrix epigloea TaxID=1892477 RepID=A0ABP0D465_9PEZI